MGTKFTGHTTIEIDIGEACLEYGVDLECELHKGAKRTFEDPGEDESVEVLSVGQMWEDIIDVDPVTGVTRKTRKYHGVPSAWFQRIIIEHVSHEDLIEQAPARED